MVERIQCFKVLSPFLLLLAGCSETPPEEPTGKLGLQLGTYVNGLRYQLTNATFDVVGPETTTLIPAPTALSTQVVLNQGSYTIDLQPGWVLEKEPAPGAIPQPVAAELVSPDPFAFTINEAQTTQVGYSFLVGGNIVGLGEGTLDLTIDVNDTNNVAQVFSLALGGNHTCALIGSGSVRCWGAGASGQLGYGNTNNIGDNETPASAGDVPVGGVVTQIVAGNDHTCALLETGSVRCWGAGALGQLGYGNTNNVGDNETPASVGDVPLGAAVRKLTAGFSHTCALLASGGVRCWGSNSFGQLGYGNTITLGDNESVSVLTDIALGASASDISAGGTETCALTSGGVRCWGLGTSGQLGYGNPDNIGDNEPPSSAGVVNVGLLASQVAVAGIHACLRAPNGAVRCWGNGGLGRTGYGFTNNIGDNELPSNVGDVNLGGSAVEISAGSAHTCARLPAGVVRCWGSGQSGKLGYGNTANVGDIGVPATAGDVNVGSPVARVFAGGDHTCVILTGSGAVRCWGSGANGKLGYANVADIGDNEAPGTVGNVSIISHYRLSVGTRGPGVVNSSPAGISACGGPLNDCREDFPAATSVTLTASPTVPAIFGGWIGTCSGTSPTTTVLMDRVHSCVATFPQSTASPMPAFVAAGAGVSSTAALNVPYPAGVVAGQLLILQVGTRQSNAVTGPAGWTLLAFDQSTSNPGQRLYAKFATGAETGTLPVTIASGSVNAARIYSFSNVRTTSFTESSVITFGSGGTLGGPTLTTSGPNRLAVCFVSLDAVVSSMSEFSGESGGNWQEATGEFPANQALGAFSLQLQIASLPSTTTLSAGSASFGGGPDDSLCRAFALIGP